MLSPAMTSRSKIALRSFSAGRSLSAQIVAILSLLAGCGGELSEDLGEVVEPDGIGRGEQPFAGISGPEREPEDEVGESEDDPGAPGLGRLELAPGTIITYLLGWSWEGAQREGDAWVFVNDLGYTIGLESVYISTTLLGLVPCDVGESDESDESDEGDVADGRSVSQTAALLGGEAGRRTLRGDVAKPQESLRPRGALSRSVGELLIGRAYAGDSGGADASSVVAELVEVGHWQGGALRIFGAGLAGEDPYCGVHLLGAPVDAIAEDGEEFDNRSALFVGWWSKPGESERHGLEASINLQRGSVRPFASFGPWPENPELVGAAGTVTMTLVRYPASAFDGVDLGTLSPAEIAYEAFAGVMHSAEVIVAESPEE